MKEKVSTPIIVVVLVVVLALAGYFGWKTLGATPGPDASSLPAGTIDDIKKAQQQGPPPGPPLPTAKGRPDNMRR